MAAIFGQCPLCPTKARKQRLYPKYCQYHTRNQGATKEEKKAAAKKALKVKELK